MNQLQYAAYGRYLDFLSSCVDRGNVVDHNLSTLSGWLGVSASVCEDGDFVERRVAGLLNAVFPSSDGVSRFGDRSKLLDTGRAGEMADVHVGVAHSSHDSDIVGHGVGGQRRVELVDVSDEGEVVVKGKHWARNRAKKRNRRARLAESKRSSGSVGAESDNIPEWRRKDGKFGAHVGAFSQCSQSLQQRLRESQAKMLIEKNEYEAVKASAARRRMDAEQRARLDELQFELDRVKFDKERKEMIEKHLASLPVGYAETLASAGIDSGVPSLSDGSVSPSSSISMAEVQAMIREIASLKEQVAFDAAEFTEENVKLKARLAMAEESKDKAVAAEKAKYDELNRLVCSDFGTPKRVGTRVYGGNGYSSWSR